MEKIIKFGELELILAKEFLVDPSNIEKIHKDIDGLRNIVLDLSSAEGIKQAKGLKTRANKFIEELKQFCEPLEAEGKKISDARSAISTKLITGKNSVISDILSPISEREEKIKSLKARCLIPSLDANSNAAKILELNSLDGYEWLGFKDEIVPLIEQQKIFLLGEKAKFDEEARIARELQEKIQKEKEDKIRFEAETKAKEKAQKEIDEANARVEAIKIEAEKKIEKAKNAITNDILTLQEPTEFSKEHQAKIHNEILYDLVNNFFYSKEEAQSLIRVIAKGSVRNLKIIY